MKLRNLVLLSLLLSVCLVSASGVANAQTTANLQPYIVPRGAWLASDPSTASGDNSCKESNETITNAFIHHTSSDESWAETMAFGNEARWVYWIQQLHMSKSNCDIGYHYLIGPSGTIYEGRKGGIHTKGGHLENMNTGTVGIAMLGNFNTNVPTPSAILSLQQLLTWLLLDNNLQPAGLNYVKNGHYYSPAISGHRHMNWSPDVDNHTSCPGDALFNYLATLRVGVENRIRNIQANYLFKTSNNPTIYRVTNGVKHPFTSSYVYNSYYGDRWDYVNVKDSSFLAAFPTGSAVAFRDGTVLGYADRPWDQTLFVVYQGQKRAFQTWDYFLLLGGRYQLGYSADKIMRVPGSIVDQIPRGPDMIDIVQCSDCRNT